MHHVIGKFRRVGVLAGHADLHAEIDPADPEALDRLAETIRAHIREQMHRHDYIVIVSSRGIAWVGEKGRYGKIDLRLAPPEEIPPEVA